jgi:ribosomal protein L19
VKVGDILRVTFKNGDPFSGVCLSIRLRGIDTSFLLRNELTRVGVEMAVKVFSPNVESVEIVQRTEKRKRRARLYYMRYVSPSDDGHHREEGSSCSEANIYLSPIYRKPRHDMRSVENIVSNYLRQKSVLTGQRSAGARRQRR